MYIFLRKTKYLFLTFFVCTLIASPLSSRHITPVHAIGIGSVVSALSGGGRAVTIVGDSSIQTAIQVIKATLVAASND